MLRQGTEHQDTVNLVIGIDGVDGAEQLLLADTLRQQELLHRNAQGFRTLGGALFIAQIVRPLAAAYNGQGGVHAPGLQLLALRNDAGIELFIDFLSQQLFCHDDPPFLSPADGG